MAKNSENLILYFYLKYLFLIILLPKYIQMFVIISCLVFIAVKTKKIKVNQEIIPFMLIGVVHILSIFLNCMEKFNISRIYAAFNTASLWIFGGMIYSYIKSSYISIDIKKINKYMYNNMIILIVLSILMIGVEISNLNNISIFSRELIGNDWINGEKTTRLMGFMEYSNLISLLYFSIFPFCLNYVKEKKTLISKALLVMSILPVFLNHSRIGIILAIINILLSLPTIINNNSKSKFIFRLMLIMCITFAFILFKKNIFDKVFNLINSRTGSTSTRSFIYQKSIEKAFEKPIFGCGIKEYIVGYPLGSHSTIIGLFYKTGFIGLFLGIIGFIQYVCRLFKINRVYIFSSLCLLLMLIIEDLDGTNWFIILFFIIYAIRERRKKDESVIDNSNI